MLDKLPLDAITQMAMTPEERKEARDRRIESERITPDSLKMLADAERSTAARYEDAARKAIKDIDAEIEGETATLKECSDHHDAQRSQAWLDAMHLARAIILGEIQDVNPEFKE